MNIITPSLMLANFFEIMCVVVLVCKVDGCFASSRFHIIS